MIDLFILNPQLELVGEVSEYINLEFERNFNDYSTMILNVQATKENIEYLKTGNYVSPQSNPSFGYVIEHISYTQNNNETLEVVAFSLNYLLSLRTIYPQQYYYGTHERIIRSFIDRNAISPLEPYRKIPLLRLGNLNNIGNSIASSRIGSDLLTHTLGIANSVLATVDVLINFQDRMLDVVVSGGANRSVNQTANPVVIFSEDYDNILQENYFYSLLKYKSSPLVAGEGEGSARQLVDVNQLSGLQRREVFVDARDLQSTYRDDNNEEQTLSPIEYTSALISRGNEAIVDLNIIETFEATIDNSQFVYGTDFFIGDIVTVRNVKLGITIDVQISSVKTVSNSSGTTIIPSLGTGTPSLYKRGGN